METYTEVYVKILRTSEETTALTVGRWFITWGHYSIQLIKRSGDRESWSPE